jgi:two-component system, NarL family, invasion response regulator UvrY
MEHAIRVGLISNDQIFLKGLYRLIDNIGRYDIVVKCRSNEELLQLLKAQEKQVPELLLINTDEIDEETEMQIAGIKARCYNAKILLMSNYNNQYNIVKALKCGANGYVARNCDIDELHKAMLSVYFTDLYYNESFTGFKLSMTDRSFLENMSDITSLEREALSLFATEMSYKEIAEAMGTSVEIVEAYRDLLFGKFKVKSRVGLVVWAFAIGELSIQKKVV